MITAHPQYKRATKDPEQKKVHTAEIIIFSQFSLFIPPSENIDF